MLHGSIRSQVNSNPLQNTDIEPEKIKKKDKSILQDL